MHVTGLSIPLPHTLSLSTLGWGGNKCCMSSFILLDWAGPPPQMPPQAELCLFFAFVFRIFQHNPP